MISITWNKNIKCSSDWAWSLALQGLSAVYDFGAVGLSFANWC